MHLTLRHKRELLRHAPKIEVVVNSEWFKRGDWQPISSADYRKGHDCTPKSDAEIEKRIAGGAK